jgi:cob(I)alamin adenosyltransferase
VRKDDAQVEALGAFDELNVEIGGARLALPGEPSLFLAAVQSALIAAMGEIACAEEDAAAHASSKFARLAEADLERIDKHVANLEARGVSVGGWATPGSTPASLALDRARVAARRAERRLAALPAKGRRPTPLLQKWVNRLSDALWLMARDADARP